MSPLSTRQKVGLVLGGIYSAGNIASVLQPTPEGEVGPPFGILLISSVLGVVGLVAVVLAWRGSRAAMRAAAGCIIVETITALPAFFVDVPTAVKMMVGAIVLLTVVTLVLMFSSADRPAAVLAEEGR